eukprot:755516-Hanusia_phi.AAC.1
MLTIRSFFKNWDKIHDELLSSDIALVHILSSPEHACSLHLRLNSLSRQTNERREAEKEKMKLADDNTAPNTRIFVDVADESE